MTPHGNGIQLRFTWRGREWRPTLKLQATPANLKHAARLRADVIAAIRSGTFQYGKWFPEAKNAPPSAPPLTFGAYATRWLASLTDYAHATRQDYGQILDRVWLPKLEERPIEEIRYSELVEILGEAGVGGKTRNNNLIPLRGVLEFAKIDKAITENPAVAIRNSPVQRPTPDPFELHEVDTILADIGDNHHAQVENYFTAMFFAGFRPSEAIALRWTDIDFSRRLARVQRAVVRAQAKAQTKTHSVRDVELTDRAYAAIVAQKAHTFLANGAVFHNPNLGRAWHDEQSQTAIWARVLKHCGLRHRDSYQTRHTFATLALMTGANPMWVARQLGHRNMKMVLEVYSKWIDAADKGKERAKLDDGFRTNVAQKNEKEA